ncbi:hypothetical protein A1F94_009675 [Pyrenophora tritici-repentis]|uniref:Uncharacterized protein n=1 Tax=Pyrenophora tritici-repentis TaxID=45151 RepID=A0A922STM2_9PLEO|nr:hypothetical protein A1F94_009675 [Pyrenophora tritici-repentis]KAI0577743.1 hypothetical protein Alg130_08241 [Pyrenophora tritici-repentis]KAI0604495.1 hypothetical protein TUN205_11259 [Pyrenophora tritici-repentis]KAI0616752.1 hypothetical protein TUN199_11257 [Pyrenophora tritici-repentis]KAI1508360.1 hypothetical protein Ptr86124_012582 [Pyrenophora tritici-repentis]
MADTARRGIAQKHGRPGSRIVPAIPYRLYKAQPSARPITPEESNKGTVTQQPESQPESQPEPHPVAEQQSEEQPEEHHVGAADTPPTPDSRASEAGKRETDESVVASVPSKSEEEDTAAADVHDAGKEKHVNGHVEHAPTTTTESQATPKPAVNGVHRKLTIPSHLPPPFYPSNRTPPADVNGRTHSPLHRHQLSAGAVVFQSANVSPTIPITPQEPELDTNGQHSLARPPPGFGPPQLAPFFAGPVQHVSEAGAPWQLPPHTVAPPDTAYENGVEYRPSQFGAPNAYPNPYNGHFSPEEAAFAANGAITSHSQSPSKAHFGEVMPSSEHGEDQHAVSYQNGSAPPAEHLEQSPFELASYLSTQFGNPEFADFILQIRSPESILVSMPVHGIVVVRSPVIADAIRRSPAPSHRSRDARRLVDVLALDPFASRESLEEAVKVLYGAPLISAPTFLYGLTPYMYEADQVSPSNDAGRRMRQVLSYIAAARTLQMPSMQARGIEIARMLLRWDTVDQVLQYALQANLGSRSRADSQDTEDPFVAMLLNYALEFIAFTFPVDFKLYSIAPEFKETPRLPPLVEPRQSTHNPRLSKIRFGDAPPEDELQPSHATVVLSTILLSLPLPLIERLFNHRATANQIGWTGAVKILRDVVNERENRRKKVSRGQLKPAQGGTMSAVLLNNVFLEEHVEQVEPSPLHPSGHRLTTKRVAGEV